MKENAFPRLVVFRDRIVENTRRIVDLCRRSGLTVTGVTKGVCAHPCVVNAMLEGGCSCLADSRIENVMLLKKCVPSAPVLLLRIPMPGEIRKVVAHADCCAVSMTDTILLIQRECERTESVYSVLLMFDLGDLREGFWPDEIDSIAATLRSCPRVCAAGVGVNFGCFGGTIPSVRALEELVHIRDSLETILGVPIPMISGGATSSLSLLEKRLLPKGVNNLRIGEGILLGHDVTRMQNIPYLYRTTMELEAEIVEIRRKPSVPIGEIAYDAFGRTPVFTDRGIRMRAIAAIGKQDVDIDGLKPCDPGVIVLGASSDHLVLDVDDMVVPPRIGATLRFSLNYSAMLDLATSPYVPMEIL